MRATLVIFALGLLHGCRAAVLADLDAWYRQAALSDAPDCAAVESDSSPESEHSWRCSLVYNDAMPYTMCLEGLYARLVDTLANECRGSFCVMRKRNGRAAELENAISDASVTGHTPGLSVEEAIQKAQCSSEISMHAQTEGDILLREAEQCRVDACLMERFVALSREIVKRQLQCYVK